MSEEGPSGDRNMPIRGTKRGPPSPNPTVNIVPPTPTDSAAPAGREFGEPSTSTAHPGTSSQFLSPDWQPTASIAKKMDRKPSPKKERPPLSPSDLKFKAYDGPARSRSPRIKALYRWRGERLTSLNILDDPEAGPEFAYIQPPEMSALQVPEPALPPPPPHLNEMAAENVQRWFNHNANHMTHRRSRFMGRTVFLVEVAKYEKVLQSRPSVASKFKIRVNFVRSPEQHSLCAEKCASCGVCPHLYACDCAPKFANTEWCSHIHLMHMHTQGKYGLAVCMLVSDDWMLTEIRHLRALIQGPSKMVKLDGGQVWRRLGYKNKLSASLYEENLESTPANEKYVVSVKGPQWKCRCADEQRCEKCEACLCAYKCRCADNWFYKQICEHMHIVAMKRLQESRGAPIFDDFTPFRSKCRESIDDEEAANWAHYAEEEHDMSNTFALGDVEKLAGTPPTWLFKARYRNKKKQIVIKEIIKLKAKEATGQCYCVGATKSTANYCSRCKVCRRHFQCECDASKYLLCRHIHLAARYREETPAEIYDHMQNRYPPLLESPSPSAEFPLPIRGPKHAYSVEELVYDEPVLSDID